MPDVERRLRELAGEIAFPAAPDISARIAERLEPRRRPVARRLALVAAVAVAALALASVLALSSSARSAFLELFRLRGATVERVDRLPVVDARRALDLGDRVSAGEAERRAGFALVRPSALGPPDATFVRGALVTFLYGTRDRPRALFSQLRADIDEGLVKKAAAGGTRVERVTVGGQPGIYVRGPHLLWLATPAGGTVPDEPYLAGTTLLWEHGALTLRLESDLDRERAIEAAESVR